MRISDWSSDVCSSDLLHRQRRVRLRDAADRGLVVEIFVAVPLAAGDPPGGAVAGDREFGQFVGDVRGLEVGLFGQHVAKADAVVEDADRKHTSELQSLMRISYAVFCLKTKNTKTNTLHHTSSREH